MSSTWAVTPERQRFDYYPTPDPFVHWLHDWVAAHLGPITGRLVAPCHGSGTIAQLLGAVAEPTPGLGTAPLVLSHTNDLDPRWETRTSDDATSDRAWSRWEEMAGGPFDWCVENPPFVKAAEIIEQALAHTRVGVAMHVRCTLNEPTKKPGLRREFLRANPPTAMLWLPRFAYQRNGRGKWSSDSATCVWLIWSHGRRRAPGAVQFIDYAPPVVVDAAVQFARDRARAERLAKMAAARGCTVEELLVQLAAKQRRRGGGRGRRG